MNEGVYVRMFVCMYVYIWIAETQLASPRIARISRILPGWPGPPLGCRATSPNIHPCDTSPSSPPSSANVTAQTVSAAGAQPFHTYIYTSKYTHTHTHTHDLIVLRCHTNMIVIIYVTFIKKFDHLSCVMCAYEMHK